MKKVLHIAWIALVCGAFLSNYLSAAEISEIKIKGNSLSSDRLIFKNIRSRVGTELKPIILNEDIKRLNELGRFSKIEVKEEIDWVNGGNKVKIIFIVEEKPIIKERTFSGSKKLKVSIYEDKLVGDIGSRYDKNVVMSDQQKIEQAYRDEGFLFSKVKHSTKFIDTNNQFVQINYEISENSKLKIADIRFTGNERIESSVLKKIMETKVDRLIGSGVYDAEKFAADLDNLELYYKTQGYLDATVKHGKSYFSKDKKWLYLNVEIEEGNLYVIDQIVFNGNSVVSDETLLSRISSKIGTPYSARVKWEVETELDAYYGEIGRVFTNVRVDAIIDSSNSHIVIKIDIAEGEIIHLEDIIILGNAKTKEVVIRRELTFYPKDRLDTTLINESKRNLINLGFFETVDILYKPGSDQRHAVVHVKVTEKQTGSINFALGFSSLESIFGQVKYVQRNFDWRDTDAGPLGFFNGEGFLGDGQNLQLAINTGSRSRRFTLDFNEPWIFNRKIRFGYGMFHTESDIAEDFEEKRSGFYLRVGKEFMKDLEGFITYNFARVSISDLDFNVSPAIREQEGKNSVSSIVNEWIYDSRDNRFFPTTGYYVKSSIAVAGRFLSGTQDFYKTEFEIKKFQKMFEFGSGKNMHVLSSRLRLGYANNYADSSSVPIFERFFAGGLGSVRGFENRSLSPIEFSNGERFEIGGNFLSVLNLEYNIPISEKTFRAVVFYDQGNAYDSVSNFSFETLRSSVGVGLRIQLDALGPMPISLDLAKPIIKKSGDQLESFSFNFGNFF